MPIMVQIESESGVITIRRADLQRLRQGPPHRGCPTFDARMKRYRQALKRINDAPAEKEEPTNVT